MQVRVDCARCRTPVRFSVPGREVEATCAACGHRFAPHPPSGEDKGLERCAACGECRLYRQKDLNRTAGLLVVLGSAGVSLALLPFSPLAAYSVLFLLALVDFGLYRLLPEVVICYRCKGRHRGFAPETEVEPFDLLTAEVIDQQVREEEEGKRPAQPA